MSMKQTSLLPTIRQANSSDAEAVRQLLVQLGYPELTEKDVIEKIKFHRHEGYQLLVADIGGKVVGFISLHWFDLVHWREKLGRITSFCVDEGIRSQGVGRKLLEAGEKLLLSKGCVKIEVTSNARRTRAHQFYLGLGYAEDSKRFVKSGKSQTT